MKRRDVRAPPLFAARDVRIDAAAGIDLFPVSAGAEPRMEIEPAQDRAVPAFGAQHVTQDRRCSTRRAPRRRKGRPEIRTVRR